jgi:hypothetical protein
LLRLQGGDFPQAAQMSLGSTELGRQERLDEVQATGGPTVRPPMQRMFM